MLSLFRRLRNSVLKQNGFKKYILYALGEILLVMIGILLALQVNNWNENKKELAKETLLLKEMAKNLQADLIQFESEMNEMKIRLKKIAHLHTTISNGKMIYSDTLHTYFGAIYGVENSNINTANYEDLKSRGFDLIRDDSLRLEINQFFEKAISKMKDYEKSEAAVNEVLKPFYLQNFFEIDFKKYAVPINPEHLADNVYYQNLIYYRMINLKRNQMTHHPDLIKGMKNILQSIDEYL